MKNKIAREVEAGLEGDTIRLRRGQRRRRRRGRERRRRRITEVEEMIAVCTRAQLWNSNDASCGRWNKGDM